MIERSKTFKRLDQKREPSEMNCKPTTQCVSNPSKVKAERHTGRKAAGSVSANSTTRNYDQQLKMKLMDLTPRNRAKETSEGVQEFIKHVSDIIEKKNPFKETAVCSWPKGIKKEVNSPVIDSIQFNGVSKKDREEDLESEADCQIDLDDINKKVLRKLKVQGKLNSVPLVKKESATGRGKMNRPRSAKKKRDQRNKRHEKCTLPLKVEAKAIKCVVAEKKDSDVSYHKTTLTTQERVPATKRTPNEQNTLRRQHTRGRPSEIPLRKGRTDLTRKTKPLSAAPEKSTERAASQSRSGGCISPRRKDQNYTTQMTINVNFSSEKISIIEEETEPLDRVLKVGTNNCIKLDKNAKNADPSTSPSREVLEEYFTTENPKVIDLEKVKTSSFTVLNNTALNRLESLHKKNILSKDKSPVRKGSSQRALSSKSSFSTLKGKSSKNHLGGTGNKPETKKKVKKGKKEGNVDNATSRKRSKSFAESSRFDREKMEANGKVKSRVPRGRKTENVSDKFFEEPIGKNNDNQPERVRSARGRSTSRKVTSPRKLTTPKDEEEDKMTLAERKSIETVVSGLDSESQIVERTNSARNSLLIRVISEQNIGLSSSMEKKMETAFYSDSQPCVPMTPPPTPEVFVDDIRRMEHDAEEEDHWASKTAAFDEKYNNENNPRRAIKLEIPQTTAERTELIPKKKLETTMLSLLVVKGMSVNTGEDEPPEGPDSPGGKRCLKIDLRVHGTDSKILEKDTESETAVNVLNEGNSNEGLVGAKTSFSDTEHEENKEGKSQESSNGYAGMFSTEITDEPGPLSVMLQKSCSSLKRKSQAKSCAKGGRKKKMRSDAGDRPSSSASVVFNSDPSIQNKTKLDAKVRSGLTKSSKRDETSAAFEDMPALRLKRRNSEPNSFRGYVWKCADSATPKDHKASASSLTSSLRHLNTDEIDDFIFWEAIPQKMTSCWEMSLYHFKRPWSVLSCSVFKDNRESSTPGLILENLRNGGTLCARRFAVNQSERAVCRQENPFDVEPSIAQKNIDIRNWLAALNFPTPPSTSNDAYNEGNFTRTTPDGQNLNKPQANPKRRKVVPNLKFSEEASKKKFEETKYRKSPKWCNEEGLTDLVRRKSGGFVTCDQYLNSEQSAQRPNVTVNFCVYSKSAEESVLVETSDRATVCEPRKYKSVEITSQPGLSISATIINSGAVVGDQLIEITKPKEKPVEDAPVQEGTSLGNLLCSSWGNIHIPKGDNMPLLRPDINIWKYLFLITAFVIVMHYINNCYINNCLCRN